MEKIKLASDVDVKVLPRLEVLYYFVYELAESFGAEEDILSSIKTGILDNQIIDRISIRYKNNEGMIVGKIIIDIDWEKHFCLAKTEEGNFFEIDMSKSVVDNIVGWKKYIVQHIQEIRKQFNVVKIDGNYHYREEIYEDKEEYKKALKIMGHVQAPLDKEYIDENLARKITEVIEESNNFEKKKSYPMDKISPTCGSLGEVTLSIYSKKI